MREQRFAMPSQAVPWTPTLAALDAQTFAAWLDAQGLDDPALRWYLDYCCRDDYGAPAAVVSAWAGLQYFCSRHGFLAPDTPEAEASQEPVLTWPEGNAWLVERLASGLDSRLHLNRLALQVVPGRQGVEVLAWRADEQQVERWQAQQVVLAVPLAMGARLLGEQAPAALQTAMRDRFAGRGGDIFAPTPRLATDNAAMIAAAGLFRAMRGERADPAFTALASLPIPGLVSRTVAVHATSPAPSHGG